ANRWKEGASLTRKTKKMTRTVGLTTTEKRPSKKRVKVWEYVESELVEGNVKAVWEYVDQFCS
ncbi:hypothetical protein EJB05_49258, partial [Eragrostis curvula]